MNDMVLVTGGAGFIGSHLCELLVGQGRQVIAIDDLSTGQLENVEHLRPLPNFQFVRESITNTQVLDRLASQSGLIIHLAAAVGVQLIVQDPVHTIRTNVMGTEAVLTTANRYGCKVLLASTSEVYGKGVKVPFGEEDDCLIGPTSHSRWSYATSKAIDEFLGLAYFREFGLPVVIFRLFNTIGPRQTGRYGMVVPRFVQQALKHEDLTVYGDGNQSRCFADIRDVTHAVTGLADNPEAVGQVFNIGAIQEITILELARKVIQLTASASQIRLVPYDQAYEPGFEDMRRRAPNLAKIHHLTGYSPHYDLDETLLSVIAYERMRNVKGFRLLTILLLALAGCSIARSEPTVTPWKPADVRLIDPVDAPQPTQDLVALYARNWQDDLQIRLDFLDLSLDPTYDLMLALDYAPGGGRQLPWETGEEQPWDLLVALPAQGSIEVLEPGGSEVEGWVTKPGTAVRVLRDPVKDSLEISLDRNRLGNFSPVARVSAFVTEPGNTRVVDQTDPVLLNGPAPARAVVLFAFSNAFPAYTPSQGLRRWDGAHTGPMGGRHGLYNLLRTAHNHRIPLVLLDLQTPAALAALDYQGGLELARDMAKAGELALASALPEV